MSAAENKSLRTSRLEVDYLEWNPEAPRSVVLLHGWPDSPRTWLGVAPLLADAGYRVFAPALRGFGNTRFIDTATPRSGELVALGRDLIEFVQALQLQKPALVGHDWGARAVANAAGLMPGLASHLAMLSVGYGTNDPAQAMPFEQARNYWYHWFMATPLGEKTVRADPRGFARTMWDTWSPPGWFDDEEFDATAASFNNPDWIDITLHSYRHRWGHAEGDPQYAADIAALKPLPVITAPMLVIHGAVDTVNPVESSAGKERWFSGPYRRVVLERVGHFPQREAAAQVAQALLDFFQSHQSV
jgi:pimeloyl-ACP methyl ester carboxylesterase